MKQLVIISTLLFSTLCSCQKSSADLPADLFDGKKLEGKWTPVRSTVTLKYNDGTVQASPCPQSLVIFSNSNTPKLLVANRKARCLLLHKTPHLQALGHFTDKAELDLIYNSTGGNHFQYRRIDELDEHTLILSADDRMVLFVEVNNLNQNGAKRITGGSVFEEFKR